MSVGSCSSCSPNASMQEYAQKLQQAQEPSNKIQPQKQDASAAVTAVQSPDPSKLLDIQA